MASFAYAASHPVSPLPDAVFARVHGPRIDNSDETNGFEPEAENPVQIDPASVRTLSREQTCSAIAAAARANDLPVPFFANLIWQESSFNPRTVSRAGALGIAQFMPETAKLFGLTNPFDPIHALHAAGKFLRQLQEQFGNLGLAAAAYNAGPGRVSRWMSRKSGSLPEETRNYVIRITGRPAEQWRAKKLATVMPAKAPCVEVAQAVQEARAAAGATEVAEAAAKAEKSSRSGSKRMARVRGGLKVAKNVLTGKYMRSASRAVRIQVADASDAVVARVRTAKAGRSAKAGRAAAAVKKAEKKTVAHAATPKRTRVASAAR